MTRKQLRGRAQQALLYFLVILVAIYALFPFYWAFVTSFKTENEMFQTAAYLPRNPTLQNYQYVFSGGSFMLALRNSALVSSAASIFALVAGSFAAYALGAAALPRAGGLALCRLVDDHVSGDFDIVWFVYHRAAAGFLRHRSCHCWSLIRFSPCPSPSGY